MIDKNDVIRFFDRCAPFWDAEMIRKEDLICAILDYGGVTAGADVLDVACGTGVLFPDYLARNVDSVTGIDISPEMAKIAASKYPPEQVRVICGDVETEPFDRQFDVVMVYNAFPHFPDANALISALAKVTKPGDDWHIKLYAKPGVALESGKTYRISMDVSGAAGCTAAYKNTATGAEDGFGTEPISSGTVTHTAAPTENGTLEILLKIGNVPAGTAVKVSNVKIAESKPVSSSNFCIVVKMMPPVFRSFSFRER